MASTFPVPVATNQALDVIIDTDSAPCTPTLPDTKQERAAIASVDPAPKVMATQYATTRQLGMIRFRVPKKSECFIAPGPETYDEMISLIKRECPSLASWPADKLTTHVSFDAAASNVEGVMFRVLPACWPAAVTEPLKLVAVRKVPAGTEAGPKVAAPRPVKPISELSERERLAFSEEMPDCIGKLRLEGQSRADVQESTLQWDHAVQQQLSLGDGQQVSSSLRPVANGLNQDSQVPVGSWEEAAKQGVALGDGQQVSDATGPIASAAWAGSAARTHNDAGDLIANSWRDAHQRQVLLGDH